MFKGMEGLLPEKTPAASSAYIILHYVPIQPCHWPSRHTADDGLSRRLTEKFSVCDNASRVQSWIRIDAHRCHMGSPKCFGLSLPYGVFACLWVTKHDPLQIVWLNLDNLNAIRFCSSPKIQCHLESCCIASRCLLGSPYNVSAGPHENVLHLRANWRRWSLASECHPSTRPVHQKYALMSSASIPVILQSSCTCVLGFLSCHFTCAILLKHRMWNCSSLLMWRLYSTHVSAPLSKTVSTAAL